MPDSGRDKRDAVCLCAGMLHASLFSVMAADGILRANGVSTDILKDTREALDRALRWLQEVASAL